MGASVPRHCFQCSGPDLQCEIPFCRTDRERLAGATKVLITIIGFQAHAQHNFKHMSEAFARASQLLHLQNFVGDCASVGFVPKVCKRIAKSICHDALLRRRESHASLALVHLFKSCLTNRLKTSSKLVCRSIEHG